MDGVEARARCSIEQERGRLGAGTVAAQWWCHPEVQDVECRRGFGSEGEHAERFAGFDPHDSQFDRAIDGGCRQAQFVPVAAKRKQGREPLETQSLSHVRTPAATVSASPANLEQAGNERRNFSP